MGYISCLMISSNDKISDGSIDDGDDEDVVRVCVK